MPSILKKYFRQSKLIVTLGWRLIRPEKNITFTRLTAPEAIAEAYDLFARRNSGTFAYDGDVQKAMCLDTHHQEALYFGVYRQGVLLATGRLLQTLQYDFNLRLTPEKPVEVAELSMVCKRPGVSTHYVILLIAFMLEHLRGSRVTTLTMMLSDGIMRSNVARPYGIFTRSIPEPVELERFGLKNSTHVHDFDLRRYYHPRWSDGVTSLLFCLVARKMISSYVKH